MIPFRISGIGQPRLENEPNSSNLFGVKMLGHHFGLHVNNIRALPSVPNRRQLAGCRPPRGGNDLDRSVRVSSFVTTAYAILDPAFRENLPSWRGSEHQIHG